MKGEAFPCLWLTVWDEDSHLLTLYLDDLHFISHLETRAREEICQRCTCLERKLFADHYILPLECTIARDFLSDREIIAIDRDDLVLDSVFFSLGTDDEWLLIKR